MSRGFAIAVTPKECGFSQSVGFDHIKRPAEAGFSEGSRGGIGRVIMVFSLLNA
jgi:hypothetical protein